jgi:hypothetical protein
LKRDGGRGKRLALGPDFFDDGSVIDGLALSRISGMIG